MRQPVTIKPSSCVLLAAAYPASFETSLTKRSSVAAKQFFPFIYSAKSQDSVVGIATGYELDDRGVGVRVPVGSRIFSSPCRPDRLRHTQPPIQWVREALSPGVKRQEGEADHSAPASAEVKKMWICTSTPPYTFMAQCLIR
jgi:hypothetical protein